MVIRIVSFAVLDVKCFVSLRVVAQSQPKVLSMLKTMKEAGQLTAICAVDVSRFGDTAASISLRIPTKSEGN